jgi:hypothetical protein
MSLFDLIWIVPLAFLAAAGLSVLASWRGPKGKSRYRR